MYLIENMQIQLFRTAAENLRRVSLEHRYIWIINSGPLIDFMSDSKGFRDGQEISFLA